MKGRLITRGCVVASAVVFTACVQRTDINVPNQQGRAWYDAGPAPDAEVLPADAPKILPETYFAAGRLFESRSSFVKAAEQYRQAVAVSHRYVEAYNRLGIVLSRLGQFEAACAALSEAVGLRGDSSVLRNNLGYAYMLDGDLVAAEREFSAALELEPEFYRARVNFGITLARTGRYDEALSQYLAVLPAPDAYFNLGLLYRSDRRYGEAASAFAKALEFDPEFEAAKTQFNELSTFAAAAEIESEEEAVEQVQLAVGDARDTAFEMVLPGQLQDPAVAHSTFAPPPELANDAESEPLIEISDEAAVETGFSSDTLIESDDTLMESENGDMSSGIPAQPFDEEPTVQTNDSVGWEDSVFAPDSDDATDEEIVSEPTADLQPNAELEHPVAEAADESSVDDSADLPEHEHAADQQSFAESELLDTETADESPIIESPDVEHAAHQAFDLLAPAHERQDESLVEAIPLVADSGEDKQIETEREALDAVVTDGAVGSDEDPGADLEADIAEEFTMAYAGDQNLGFADAELEDEAFDAVESFAPSLGDNVLQVVPDGPEESVEDFMEDAGGESSVAQSDDSSGAEPVSTLDAAVPERSTESDEELGIRNDSTTIDEHSGELEQEAIDEVALVASEGRLDIMADEEPSDGLAEEIGDETPPGDESEPMLDVTLESSDLQGPTPEPTAAVDAFQVAQEAPLDPVNYEYPVDPFPALEAPYVDDEAAQLAADDSYESQANLLPRAVDIESTDNTSSLAPDEEPTVGDVISGPALLRINPWMARAMHLRWLDDIAGEPTSELFNDDEPAESLESPLVYPAISAAWPLWRELTFEMMSFAVDVEDMISDSGFLDRHSVPRLGAPKNDKPSSPLEPAIEQESGEVPMGLLEYLRVKVNPIDPGWYGSTTTDESTP